MGTGHPCVDDARDRTAGSARRLFCSRMPPLRCVTCAAAEAIEAIEPRTMVSRLMN